MRTIYLVEVEDSGTWTPMYEPYYSRDAIEKKVKIKGKIFGASRVRVSVWQWIGSGPLRSPPEGTQK